MSRSYKKPIIKDGYKSKWKRKEKRFANKTLKNKDIANFGNYKKHYNSWDICDWVFDNRWGEITWKMTRK